MLLAGQTGIGKSSLSRQFQIKWALGRPCLGIEPARPLISLEVQSENDEGDLAETRDGIFSGLALTAEERDLACQRVLVVREDRHTGAKFCERILRPLLAKYKPDLLWIDPALAFVGGDVCSQETVGGFLRNQLLPLLHEFNCGCVIIHHTNKPVFGPHKANMQAADSAYMGSGSAEWANVARAVLVLKPLRLPNVFELIAAKRGQRLRWKDGKDSPTNSRYIAHAKEPGGICWRDADPEEVTSAKGRPKTLGEEELLRLLPFDGLKTGEWWKLADDKLGISRNTFYRERKALEAAGRIVRSTASGDRWQPVAA